MNQKSIQFGAPVHTLYRSDGPDTSKEAAFRVDIITDEMRVFHLIRESGDHGATLKEIATRLNKFPHCLSGRITSLQNKKLIEDSGRRRGKSRVMVVVPQKEAA